LTLTCLSSTGAELAKHMNPAGTDGKAGDWVDLQSAILCPVGTASVRITLGRDGNNVVAFRDVTAQVSPAGPPVLSEPKG
jgi:hypothetical protein